MNHYKVGIYLRLSREDEKEGESSSITNQRALLMNYIKENKLVFVDEYIDDGVSGTTFNRAGFKRLIEDIQKKRINMVITKDTSRLGRDHIEFGYYVEKFFPENNVRYVAVNDQIDTFKQENDMLLFKSAYNDMYVKDISNKIRTSLWIKKKQGEFVGAYAPYGYRKDIYDKHKLVIDDEAANVVRKIFQLFTSGISISQIADHLTKEKISIPSIHQGMNRGIKSSLFGIWTTRTITDILTNPTYIGHLTQGRSKKISYKSKKRIHVPQEEWIIKENSCPKIIEDELFYFANHMYKKNIHTRGRGEDLLLKGFVYCHECGHRIGFRKISSKYIYGDCNYYLKYRKYHVCTSHSIRYDLLEKVILDEVKRLLAKEDMNKIIEDIYQQHIECYQEKLSKRLIFLKKSIEINLKKLDTLYEDKLSGFIDGEQYIRVKEKILLTNQKLEEEIILLEQKNTDLASDFEKKKVMKFTNSILFDRNLFGSLIEKITLTKDKEIHLYYRVNCNF